MGSKFRLRLYTLLVLLLALTVTVVVVVGQGGTSSTGDALPPVNRIAYVSLDRQIITVNPDGTDEIKITAEEGSFTWPTWSPDGRTLAYSGVNVDSEGELRVGQYTYDTFSRQLRELHVGQPGAAGLLVATNAPHYAFWSPDSNHLAFVGNTNEGLQLYVDDILDGDGPKFTLGGGPMWMDWSPDSRYLFVHRGADHFLVDAEEGATEKMAIPYDGSGYHVPAWGRTDDTVTFVSGGESQGYGLDYASVPDLRRERLLDDVPGNTAFLWSPGGDFLAVTRGRPGIALIWPAVLRVYERVSLYSPQGSRQSAEIRDSVVAFFWLPDGTKLAYVTLTDVSGVLRWNILDLADGSNLTFVDFIPSIDQLVVFEFFDQYAHSHSVWSPDSTSLVMAGRTAGGAISASLGQQPVDNIIVLTAYPIPSAQVIADGLLGFWSPR